MRDTGLLGDVADPAGVEALVREHTHRGVEDLAPFLFRPRRALGQGRRRVVVPSRPMQPALHGQLVVDLSRYLPGAFASTELLRLGARVVRVEQPGGDPMRDTAPGWFDALNAGKESVVCDLPAEAPFLRALLSPGGRDPGDVAAGRGDTSRGQTPGRARAGRVLLDHRLRERGPARAARRPRSQLPGLGGRARRHRSRLAAGADRRPRRRRARRRDGGAGGAARARAHRPRRTRRRLDDAQHAPARVLPSRGRPRPAAAHRRSRLLPHLRDRRRPLPHGRRARGEVLPPSLRAAGPADLAAEQYGPEQEELAETLAAIFATRPLDAWLAAFDGEDVCVGPVATLAEAAADLGTPPPGRAAELGEHTAQWRSELP